MFVYGVNHNQLIVFSLLMNDSSTNYGSVFHYLHIAFVQNFGNGISKLNCHERLGKNSHLHCHTFLPLSSSSFTKCHLYKEIPTHPTGGPEPDFLNAESMNKNGSSTCLVMKQSSWRALKRRQWSLFNDISWEEYGLRFPTSLLKSVCFLIFISVITSKAHTLPASKESPERSMFVAFNLPARTS